MRHPSLTKEFLETIGRGDANAISSLFATDGYSDVPYWILYLNPDYALDILLQAKIPSKYEPAELLLFHHSGNYASIAKIHILLGFCLSLRNSNA